MGPPPVLSPDSVSGNISKTLILNDLLTYVNFAIERGLPVRDIAVIVANFYTIDEVEQAKIQLELHPIKTKQKKELRIPKASRQPGQNPLDKQLTQCTLLIQAMTTIDAAQCPVTFVSNLTRLPALDTESIANHLLHSKLQLLEKKVASIQNFEEKSSVLIDKITAVEHNLNAQVKHQQQFEQKLSYSAAAARPLATVRNAFNPLRPSNIAPTRPTSLDTNADNEFKLVQRRKKKSTIVIGNGDSDVDEIGNLTVPVSEVLPDRPKRAHIFLSRIRNGVPEDAIQSWLISRKVKIENIELLPIRFDEQTYQSFHITVEKGDREYDEFLSPNLWPKGALVKRWFLPRRPYQPKADNRQGKDEEQFGDGNESPESPESFITASTADPTSPYHGQQ